MAESVEAMREFSEEAELRGIGFIVGSHLANLGIDPFFELFEVWGEFEQLEDGVIFAADEADLVGGDRRDFLPIMQGGIKAS